MFEELIADLQEPARFLVLAAGQAGLHPRVTSTVRGRTEQARLYRRYQSGLAKYPVAPPGTSAHEFGFAFDMVCTPLDALEDVGYTWTTWGGVWHPQDEVHFEYPGFVPPEVPPETIADKPTGWFASLLNFGYGFIPVLGQVQLAADLSRLFPSLSHNETLTILSNPTKYFSYIAALREAYR